MMINIFIFEQEFYKISCFKGEKMSSKRAINVYSEIGKLRSVLLHRPGREIENLTPDALDRLLFDDIPFLDIATYEHDAFAKILIDNGIEVLYLEDLAAEAITE